MTDNEILDLYWNRCESAITATAEKYEKYCRNPLSSFFTRSPGRNAIFLSAATGIYTP